jgi:hypothetical protein
VGLSNIRDRLSQLYGAGQEFQIHNGAAGGAEVTVRVPYHVAPTDQTPPQQASGNGRIRDQSAATRTITPA